VTHLVSIFQKEEDSPVTIQYDIDASLRLSLEKITSFGLILNEIISNAFKYAFSGSQAEVLQIKVRLIKADLSIVISDNGLGKEADLTNSGHLGMKLIVLMCTQMGATHKVHVNGGVIHQITFKYL
jgi:two-component sensor histidine kinase